MIHYGFKDGRYKVVNRPLSKLSKMVSATEQIPEEGLLFDPLIQADYLQNEENKNLDNDGGQGDDAGGDHAVRHDDGAVQDDGEAEGHGEARQSQEQAEEVVQHGDDGTMERDAMGNGAGNHDQVQPAGVGQTGDIHRDGGARGDGAKGHEGLTGEPVKGKRNRVKTTHFWNR